MILGHQLLRLNHVVPVAKDVSIVKNGKEKTSKALKESNVHSCSKTWCEKRTRPFPDRALPIFALLVFFFFLRRSYYLQAWQRLEKNILRVWGKAQSVFFFLHVIARHFFFLGFEIMEEFFWIWPFKTTTKNFYHGSSTRYNSFLTFYNRTFQTIINVLF